jgi:hypothetical protein
MAYDHYIDQNGVTWTVVWTNGRHTALATVPDNAQPRYDPDLGDVSARMDPGGLQFFGQDIIKGDPATDEQQRVLFVELTQKIDALAAQHRRGTELEVSAHAPMSPLLVIGLLFAAAWALDELDG